MPANPRQVRLLYEVVGRHRVRSTFLYVTDGGHIENLGLLELLRRECTTIVCLDAAGGSTETFSTLGQAIALAASELNARIVIDPARTSSPSATAPTGATTPSASSRTRAARADG